MLGRAPDDPALRTRVGVMLQDGGLPLAAPAGQVLAHVAAMHARPRDRGELVDRLGLGALLRRPVSRLSGGERQRLALATALVGRPQLLLLDEPTAGLDPQARVAVRDLVRELRDDGTTILLTTHRTEEAGELADQVVVLDAGRVRAAGTPAELVGQDRGLRILLDRDPAAYRDELEHVLRVPVVASDRAAGGARRTQPGAAAQGHRLGARQRRADPRAGRRSPQPRGRRAGPDRTGAAMSATEPSVPTGPAPVLAPAHDPAPAWRRVLAQAAFEVRALVRNGEQLLLTLVLPVWSSSSWAAPTCSASARTGWPWSPPACWPSR